MRASNAQKRHSPASTVPSKWSRAAVTSNSSVVVNTSPYPATLVQWPLPSPSVFLASTGLASISGTRSPRSSSTYAIHTDKDGRNPHAHILVANRRIDPKTGRWAAKSRSEFALDANGRRIPVIDPDTGRQKIGARNRKVWKRVNVSNNPLDSKEFLERLRREWADSCNALLPGYAVIDHRSFKARGIERIPTIHEGYASREMEKRGGRGDLCEENRRIQALNRLLDALRAMIGRLSDQAQGILTAVKRRQRPSGAPQAPSSPEPAERPQERPQARETPPQAPQEPPKPIRTKKALTDRFKTRLDERLAENERKQAEKQAEPDMEETWDLSDPADPLNIGMGWGTGGHGLGL